MGAKGSKTKTSIPSSAPSTKDAWTPELFITKAKEEFYHGNEAFRDAKFDQAKTFYYEALDNLRQWNEYLHLKGSNHSVEGKSDSNTEEKAGESCRDTKSLETATMMNLGMLQFIQGCYNESKGLLQIALEKHRELQHDKPGEQSSQCLTSISVLIKRDLSLSRSKDSGLGGNEKVMISKLNEYSTLDAMIADLLNNLAACYEVMGELSVAKTLFEECLQLRIIVYGEHSLKVAETMQNLATIFDGLGITSQAKAMLSEALEIEKQLLGEDHIETAVTMNNLAVLLAHMHEYEEARKLLDKSVQLRESYYGPHHHLTICARQNLDFVLSKLNSVSDKAKIDGNRDNEKTSV